MNDKLRKRIIDGITIIGHPVILVGVIAFMLVAGWLTMGELAPLLWIVAGVCLLISVVAGQLAKGLAGQSPD